jgi:hypothetical protein
MEARIRTKECVGQQNQTLTANTSRNGTGAIGKSKPITQNGLARLLCRASGWVAEPERFGELMSRIDCRGGQTQIAKGSSACAARERPIQSGCARFHRRRHGGKSR